MRLIPRAQRTFIRGQFVASSKDMELLIGGSGLRRATAFPAARAPLTAGAACSPIPSMPVARAGDAKDGAVMIWTQALTSTMRFYFNKLLYGFFARSRSHNDEFASAAVQHVHAAAGGSRGSLPYCMGRDSRKIMCGVQPAWMYLRDFSLVGTQKFAIIRRLLAQLPGGATFHFSFQIDLPDAALVRRAFAGAGFKIMDFETYAYTPPSGQTELIDTLSGKSIKGTLRRARRDLEIVEISVRDYFRFQRANLAASGKKNNRNDNLDQLMVEEAVRRKCGRILAARRRSTDAHPGPHPLDAASICLWEQSAGLLQLWRLTYREHSYSSLMPHVDASKLLILAAMQDAADRKMTLDTDGYTKGIAKTYALFGPGVFQLAVRLHCERECLWAMFSRYYPSLGRRLGAIFPFDSARTPGLTT